MLPDDPQAPSLEEQLSQLDFSGESQSRQQLYRRLKQQALRTIYRQPPHVTVFSRLGAAMLLALVFGMLVGTLRFQAAFPNLIVTVISAPHVAPAETPSTTIAANHTSQWSHPHPLPTPLVSALPEDENSPVLRTGTRLP